MSFDPATFNPHDPAFLANPYPTYAAFRQQAPVAKVMPYGSMWVFRHDDVATVLSDATRFVKKKPGEATSASALSAIVPGVFSMDAPRHTVVRSILDDLWAEAMSGAAEFADTTAEALLAALPASRRLELMASYALPLPSSVLFHLLGVPASDTPLVTSWVGASFAGHDITAPASLQGAALSCGLALGSYFQALMAMCPAQGMVPSMGTSGVTRGLTPYEAQQSAVNLAVAGYLSTTFLIGTGVINLLTTQGAWDALLSDPSRMPQAVEEMLRFDAPAQLVDRYTTEDVCLSGVTIPAGTLVTAVIGSAQRDADAIDNADTFDIHRAPSPLLAFGDGEHYCLGAGLARTVAPSALRALMRFAPAARIAGRIQWQTDPYMRAPANLPLSVR